MNRTTIVEPTAAMEEVHTSVLVMPKSWRISGSNGEIANQTLTIQNVGVSTRKSSDLHFVVFYFRDSPQIQYLLKKAIKKDHQEQWNPRILAEDKRKKERLSGMCMDTIPNTYMREHSAKLTEDEKRSRA